MSIRNRTIITALSLGYYVNQEGEIIKNGKIRRTHEQNGYLYFSVRLGSKIIRISVHRFVAFVKYGDMLFSDGIEVRHLDGNPSNNNLNNILIGTHAENVADRPEEKRKSMAKYAASFLKIHNYDEIIKLKKEGKTYAQIMELTGVKSRSTIYKVLKENRSIA